METGFQIVAWAASDIGTGTPPAVISAGGIPVGLHAMLIVMTCAALGAMVLKRRLPGLPLLACLSVLVIAGALLAAFQTGDADIALGGACVVMGLYMLEYFSRVMESVERDAPPDTGRALPPSNGDAAPRG